MQKRSVLGLMICLDRSYDHRSAHALADNSLRRFFGIKGLFILRTILKKNTIDRLFREVLYFFITTCNNIQYRSLDPANLVSIIIHDTVKTGQRHSEDPVRFCAGISGFIKCNLVLAVKQVLHALLYTLVSKRTYPQPFHRLFAAEVIVYIPENALALTSGIAGIYYLRNIITVEQLFQHFELSAVTLYRYHSELIRDKRERFKLPLLPAVILRHSQPDQMTERVCDYVAVTLTVKCVSIFHGIDSTDTVSQRSAYRRLFRYYQHTHCYPSSHKIHTGLHSNTYDETVKAEILKFLGLNPVICCHTVRALCTYHIQQHYLIVSAIVHDLIAL